MNTWVFKPTIDGESLVDSNGSEIKIEVEAPAEASSVSIDTFVNGEEIKDNYLLPDKVYNVLKWVALLLLPTCAWLIAALSDVWDIPNAEQISMTLNICGTFIAVLIGVSSLQNAR